MTYFLLGLFVFLGLHSLRIVADGWRTQVRDQVGASAFKAVYSLLSVLSFGLMVWGFSLAREAPVLLWAPPMGMRHAASLLTLLAFVLMAAAYVPGNRIKSRLHHPMVLSVKAWALAHLLSNGNLAGIILFGAFLAWSVVNFSAARKRDRRDGVVYQPGNSISTVVTILVGGAAWALVAFKLHGMVIGIKPFG
jgi:uncharacterized membrane protein